MAKRTQVQHKTEIKARPETKPVIEIPAAAPVRTTAISDTLPFGKSNYTIMLIGLAVIAIGFFIMTLDKEEFGFGFLGITLGPIVVISGFAIELFAILKKKS